MSNPLLKMLLPKVIDMAKNKDVKNKIIEVVAKEKAKYTLEPTQDIRIILSATSRDILVRIVVFDVSDNKTVETLAIYTYEQLVDIVSNLKIS